MDQESVRDIVRRFARALRDRGIEPEQMVLYGSQARGDATEASDIDVLVISLGFAGKSYWERIDVLSEAIYAVYAPLEAVAMTPEEWRTNDSLLGDCIREGETVLEV